jgi:NACalpha-BTF3-like transcription factor
LFPATTAWHGELTVLRDIDDRLAAAAGYRERHQKQATTATAATNSTAKPTVKSQPIASADIAIVAHQLRVSIESYYH